MDNDIPDIDFTFSSTDFDPEKEYGGILQRLPQDVFAFRTTMGAVAGQRVLIDALTLPIPDPAIVRIESDDEGHISIISEIGDEHIERKTSFDGTKVTIQDGEAEPVELEADLEGIQAAYLIFSAVQAGITRPSKTHH